MFLVIHLVYTPFYWLFLFANSTNESQIVILNDGRKQTEDKNPEKNIYNANVNV